MYPECWKNDAAKVDKMESAAVKHEIGSNYGGSKLKWKSVMELIEGKKTVFEGATEMRSAMVKAWKWENILLR